MGRRVIVVLGIAAALVGCSGSSETSAPASASATPSTLKGGQAVKSGGRAVTNSAANRLGTNTNR